MIITHTSEPIPSRAGQTVTLGSIMDGEVFEWPTIDRLYIRIGDGVAKFKTPQYLISPSFFADAAHPVNGWRRLEEVTVIE
jgi:hypothetical protein